MTSALNQHGKIRLSLDVHLLVSFTQVTHVKTQLALLQPIQLPTMLLIQMMVRVFSYILTLPFRHQKNASKETALKATKMHKQVLHRTLIQMKFDSAI
jgi:hypothetical protein